MLSKVMAMELGPHKVGFLLKEKRESVSSQSSLVHGVLLFISDKGEHCESHSSYDRHGEN